MNTPWENEGTFVVAGKTLEYICIGPSPDKSPTLVLLHEGLGCIRLWRDFPVELSRATGFGVFAYSRAGYGQSDPTELPRPLDYMTQEAVDVLPVALDAIGVQRAVLLGHSDGATIAAIHAGCVVDPRIFGAVLIAPHFFTEASGLLAIENARDAFNNGDLRARLAKYHAEPDNAFRGWNDSWLHPDFKQWHIADVLGTIQCPILAIQGRKDPYGSLAQIDVVKQRVVHARVSTLIVDDCQHAPHLEHAQAVTTAIADFCIQAMQNSSIKLPSHAYIPGKNSRHPDDAFESIRQTAIPDQDADQLAQSDAFKAGLCFLNAGYYWEAHEVLEPVWMALPDDSVERRFVQGLIQLANGRLKLLMERPKAASRLVDHARSLIATNPSLTIMTLKVAEVHSWIDQLEVEVNLVL